MKRLTQALALIALAAGIFATPSFGAEVAAQSGFEYDYWNDTTGRKGTQGFIPIRVDTRFDALSVGLLTAVARTTFEPEGGPDRSLTTLLDTKVITAYEFVGKWPVDVLFGMDLNLRTGKTDLSAEDVALIQDPELVTITSFGEGFNVNPTVLVAKEWGPWVGGAGVGYLWRGKYDFSGELGLRDFRPGDIWTASATLRRDISRNAHARLFANATWFGEDKVGGTAVHKEGDFFLAGVEAVCRAGRLATLSRFRAIFRRKSKFLTSIGALAPEARNSHGDEYRADLLADYAVDSRTVLKSSLQGVWITENGYPSDSPFFTGERKKVALGAGASRRLTETLEGEIFLRGFLMKEEAALFPQPHAGRTVRGLASILRLTSRF
jgi:hypothetical protein